jgi:hypothetical protein
MSARVTVLDVDGEGSEDGGAGEAETAADDAV